MKEIVYSRYSRVGVGEKVETNLVETDVGGLLTEALTADVHLKPNPY